jgi:NMD protein affecting ribosome stability and mRNA decay
VILIWFICSVSNDLFGIKLTIHVRVSSCLRCSKHIAEPLLHSLLLLRHTRDEYTFYVRLARNTYLRCLTRVT